MSSKCNKVSFLLFSNSLAQFLSELLKNYLALAGLCVPNVKLTFLKPSFVINSNSFHWCFSFLLLKSNWTFQLLKFLDWFVNYRSVNSFWNLAEKYELSWNQWLDTWCAEIIFNYFLFFFFLHFSNVARNKLVKKLFYFKLKPYIML